MPVSHGFKVRTSSKSANDGGCGTPAQLVVTWLIHVTGNALAPAWYLLFATAVGLAAMAMMRETAPGRRAS